MGQAAAYLLLPNGQIYTGVPDDAYPRLRAPGEAHRKAQRVDCGHAGCSPQPGWWRLSERPAAFLIGFSAIESGGSMARRTGSADLPLHGGSYRRGWGRAWRRWAPWYGNLFLLRL